MILPAPCWTMFPAMENKKQTYKVYSNWECKILCFLKERGICRNQTGGGGRKLYFNMFPLWKDYRKKISLPAGSSACLINPRTTFGPWPSPASVIFVCFPQYGSNITPAPSLVARDQTLKNMIMNSTKKYQAYYYVSLE